MNSLRGRGDVLVCLLVFNLFFSYSEFGRWLKLAEGSSALKKSPQNETSFHRFFVGHRNISFLNLGGNNEGFLFFHLNFSGLLETKA